MNAFAVGDVCARVEPYPEKEGCKRLYIMTIGVLPAYRRRGIASQLLTYVLEEASKNKEILEVYLHVQTSNAEAKDFYLSKGFVQTGTIKNYYKRISPPDCYVLGKSLVEGHNVALENSNA